MSKATTRQSKGKRKVPVEPSDSNDKRIKISNDNPLNQVIIIMSSCKVHVCG